jgi:hypothetical protein
VSAAATAAGYLYASGRLRGRSSRDGDVHETDHQRDNDRHYGRTPEERAPRTKKVKVAVYSREPAQAPQPHPIARKAPKIEYRTRRWRPE